MNKKIVLSLVAVLVCGLALFGIKSIKSKDAVQGEKNLTIEIISEVDKIDSDNKLKTDKEFLGQAIEKEQGYLIENGMVVSVSDVSLKDSKSDYWHISINGKDAEVGVNEIIIKDGDVIRFERKSFL